MSCIEIKVGAATDPHLAPYIVALRAVTKRMDRLRSCSRPRARKVDNLRVLCRLLEVVVTTTEEQKSCWSVLQSSLRGHQA